jgi:hypothetical protein
MLLFQREVLLDKLQEEISRAFDISVDVSFLS